MLYKSKITMPLEFEQIQSINYWDGKPPRLGFCRQVYLQQILDYVGKSK